MLLYITQQTCWLFISTRLCWLIWSDFFILLNGLKMWQHLKGPSGAPNDAFCDSLVVQKSNKSLRWIKTKRSDENRIRVFPGFGAVFFQLSDCFSTNSVTADSSRCIFISRWIPAIFSPFHLLAPSGETVAATPEQQGRGLYAESWCSCSTNKMFY